MASWQVLCQFQRGIVVSFSFNRQKHTVGGNEMDWFLSNVDHPEMMQCMIFKKILFKHSFWGKSHMKSWVLNMFLNFPACFFLNFQGRAMEKWFFRPFPPKSRPKLQSKQGSKLGNPALPIHQNCWFLWDQLVGFLYRSSRGWYGTGCLRRIFIMA